MSENYWSSEQYESYRKQLQSLPNKLLWGAVINDLKNPFSSIFANIEFLKMDAEEDDVKIDEILVTLGAMKSTTQNLVGMISAIEDHIMDRYKSDSDNIT